MRLSAARVRFAIVALFCAAVPASPALALDHVFENLVYGGGGDEPQLRVPRLEIRDTDLSLDEARRMLDAQTPAEEAVAIAARLRAGRIALPEARIVFGEGMGELVLRQGVIETLAGARFAKLSFAGAQGRIDGKAAGEGEIVSGPMILTDGDFSKLIEAARKGDVVDGVARLGGFSWTGLRVAAPDKDVSRAAAGGNLWRLELASLTGATTYAGDIPTRMVGKMEGLVVVAPPASEAGRELAGFGLEKVDLGFAFDGQYDPATKVFALNDYSMTGAGAGALRASGSFGGVEPAFFTGDQATRLAAALTGDVRALNLTYVDNGLFQKSVAFYAAGVGKTPAALRSEWAMMAGGLLPLLTGGDPAGFRIAEAVSAFIREPRSFSVSMKGKAGPLRFMDFAAMSDPATFFAKVDLTVVANK